MSGESWQTLGNFVNTAGLAGFAITGANSVLAGYQAYASPYAWLAKSERKLERVRSRLQELSPQQREEIDSQCRVSNCKSLKDLEVKHRTLMNTYYRLSKGCDEMAFVDRHIPYSEFRYHLSRFEEHAKALLKDTLKTTVPCVDDMGFDQFDPQNPGLAMDRSSSSESSITFPIPNHPASSTIVETIPMTRV